MKENQNETKKIKAKVLRFSPIFWILRMKKSGFLLVWFMVWKTNLKSGFVVFVKYLKIWKVLKSEFFGFIRNSRLDPLWSGFSDFSGFSDCSGFLLFQGLFGLMPILRFEPLFSDFPLWSGFSAFSGFFTFSRLSTFFRIFRFFWIFRFFLIFSSFPIFQFIPDFPIFLLIVFSKEENPDLLLSFVCNFWTSGFHVCFTAKVEEKRKTKQEKPKKISKYQKNRKKSFRRLRLVFTPSFNINCGMLRRYYSLCAKVISKVNAAFES